MAIPALTAPVSSRYVGSLAWRRASACASRLAECDLATMIAPEWLNWGRVVTAILRALARSVPQRLDRRGAD